MSASQEVSRLQRLYELSMTLSGDPMDIFVHVARMIGELLEVKVVCLSEIRGAELFFLSVYLQGEIRTHAGHCPLEITPCATVQRSKELRIYDRVMERFPRAGFLREHNAYSYCGFPSMDNDGNVVAVTCLLDDRPHEFTRDDQELLRIAGQRIALEIARKRLNDERAQALEALRHNEARLRDVLDAGGHFLWEADADGRFTYLTPGLVEIFGQPIPDLLGSTPFEFPFADDVSRVRDTFFQAVREKRPFRGMEHRLRAETGDAIWVSVSGAPMLDDQGELAGFRGTVSDITGRKNADVALRESEERLELALRGADLGLWDWDIPTGKVYFSDQWIRMLGYSRDEIQPHYDQWVRLVHPEDMPGVLTVLEAHLAGKSPYYQVEHRLRTKSGGWKWVWSSGKVLAHGPAGVPLRAAGTHLDISERKALEERLMLQQAELAHAQRVTTAGELAATIVHELNQPLGAISGYVGAVNAKFPDVLSTHSELQHTLDVILRLTQRAAGIVRGIRDLVRRSDVDPEWVDLHDLIGEILLFTRRELTRRHIRLIIEVPRTLPKILGDRIQLQQLFLNLVLNAMDAMDAVDHSRRHLTLRATHGADRTVATIVTDTGPGIAPEIMTKLFEPFVTSKANGIGLGLSLCRTIAEAYGGSISALSAAGQGATFKVVLPTGKAAACHES